VIEKCRGRVSSADAEDVNIGNMAVEMVDNSEES
jgi:hypothetical protein